MEECSEENGQFLNLELAIDKISNSWEETPRFGRGMQNTVESQEEFEFSMYTVSKKDDSYEPVVAVASADVLFYKGQLLPLQYDPRLQLVHTFSGTPTTDHLEDSSGSGHDMEKLMKCAYGEAFVHGPSEDDEFFYQSAFEQGNTNRCGTEEASLVKDVVGEALQCRFRTSDGGIDLLKNDSRSSSFRSQQSSYWGYSEKDSRNSSCSSRGSYGGSQDGSCRGYERRLQRGKKIMGAKYSSNSGANEGRENLCQQREVTPPKKSKDKRWRWKAVVYVLKKASRLWMDEREEEYDLGSSSKGALSKPQLSPTGRMQKHHDGNLRGTRQGQNSRCRRAGHEEHGNHNNGKYNNGNAGYRGYGYYDGVMHGGSKPGIDKSRLGIIAWNARDSWEKWVRRPFSGKLSHTPKRSSCTMDDMQVSFNIKARSVSSTPLAKSPDRSIENVVNNPDMYGTYSSKHSSVAFAASCPASMRSSPHHSGVLAVINKTAPPSYLTDLHTAIQGAIAHCKQSQSNNLS